MTIPQLFTALYWAWIALEILLQLVTRSNRSHGKLKDRGSLLLLFPVVFASVWVATWYGETHAPTMPGAVFGYRAVGLALLIAGLVIRCTAILSLGSSFSTNVAIHATQTLRTTGLYRWVRHPSYTGMLIIFTGVGIYLRNWVSLAIVLVFPIAVLLYRMHVEELALSEAFGDEYRVYSSGTSRLLPGIY